VTSYKRKLFEKQKRKNPVAKDLSKREFHPRVVEAKSRNRMKVTPRDIEKFILEEKEDL
jgi:hypothetical protein